MATSSLGLESTVSDDLLVAIQALRGSHANLSDNLVLRINTLLNSTTETTSKETTLRHLADAAREPAWRVWFGEVGLLRLCLRGLQNQLEPEQVTKQRLRMIGNACADTDSNREVVIREDGYEAITRCIVPDHPLMSLALVVFYNFLNDYESAQEYVITHNFIPLFNEILRKHTSSQDFPEYGIRCLGLLLQSTSGPVTAPDEIIINLLEISRGHDFIFEDFRILLECITLLLKIERFQLHIASRLFVDECLQLILRTNYWTKILSSKAARADEGDTEDDTEEDLKYMQETRSLLVAAMSDISALDLFAQRYNPPNRLFDTIITWLEMPNIDLQTCAALVLGNIAKDQATCKVLLDEYGIDTKLVDILRQQSQIGVLYAAGGALKNIGIQGNDFKTRIVKAGVFDYCHKFYSVKVMVEVQHMGLSLVRILITGSSSNFIELLGLDKTNYQSPIDILLSNYNSTQELPIRTEISRIVIAVLRELTRSEVASENVEACEAIHALSNRFVAPLMDVVEQQKWPVISSEGWFGLALLAKSKAGANAIFNTTLSKGFCVTLLQTMGRDGDVKDFIELANMFPQDTTSMESGQPCENDKSNATVFLSQVLRNTTVSSNSKYLCFFRSLLDGKPIEDPGDLFTTMEITNKEET